jgi:hypothetical protein
MSASDEKVGIAMAELERELLHESNGTAALGICESLLLALIDLKLISGQVAHDLLSDVITAHTNAAELSEAPQKHQAVAEIVQRILIGKVGNGLGRNAATSGHDSAENGEAVASRTRNLFLTIKRDQ